MPRTYGGEAAEDIEFRSGLLAPPGAATSALPAPASIPAGSPLGVRGYRGGGGGITAGPGTTPAATGGGGILGLTGGQAALAAMSGVASFLGGYQRNPGLLQISRNVTGALHYDIQRQEQAAIAQQIAEATAQAIGPEPINNAKVAAEAKNRFLQAGMVDQAMKFAALEDKYIDNAREQAKEDRQAVEADENQFLRWAGPRIQKHLDVTDAYDLVSGIIDQGRTNPETLSDAQRAAIVIAFAKQQSPEALSDTEFARNIRDRNFGVVFQLLRGPLGALGISSGGVPTNTVIGNLAEVVQTNARTAAHQLNRIAALGKVGEKNLDLPTVAPPGSFGPNYKGVPSSPFAKKGLPGELLRPTGPAVGASLPGTGPLNVPSPLTGAAGFLPYILAPFSNRQSDSNQ